MTSSGGGPLEFDHIQEIVDIELMFEVICMFFVVFLLSSFQIIRKEEINNKQEKVLNYYYITILYNSKTHVNSSLLFDQFISNIQEIIDIEWMFELICMFFFCLFILIPNDKEKRKSTVKQAKVVNYYYITVP